MPKFFGDEATRLIRKYWGDDAEALAEELYAMFQRKSEAQQQQPLTITRDGDQPAIRIIDNSDGTSSPIQIVKGNDGPAPAIDPGGGKCCGDGGGGGGVGSGKPDDPNNPTAFPPPTTPPPVTPGGGTGDPNLPRRLFNGTLAVRWRQGEPDTYHFNGTIDTFTGTACLPYKPPTVPPPTSAQVIPEVMENLKRFQDQWHLDSYDVVDDTVGPPGATCTG